MSICMKKLFSDKMTYLWQITNGEKSLVLHVASHMSKTGYYLKPDLLNSGFSVLDLFSS